MSRYSVETIEAIEEYYRVDGRKLINRCAQTNSPLTGNYVPVLETKIAYKNSRGNEIVKHFIMIGQLRGY